MSKYHINRNGEPALCRAQAGNCPLGDSNDHFDNKVDATREAERRFSQEAGGSFASTPLSSVSTETSTSVDTLPLQTRELAYREALELQLHAKWFRNAEERLQEHDEKYKHQVSTQALEDEREVLQAAEIKLANETVDMLKRFNNPDNLDWSDLHKY